MAPWSFQHAARLNPQNIARNSDGQGRHRASLFRRQNSTSNKGNNISMIVGFAVIAFVMITVSVFCFMRNRKRKARDRTKYQQAPLSEPSDTRRPNTSSISNSLGASAPLTTTAVNRATSIRSIMTLPAYQPNAAENERVLGVEGERDGVDVILELPTESDLENMRENEMESLYQIRLARRLEIQEREERRRLRREARQNNDPVALRNLRQQRQAANERDLVAALREEHERIKAQRQRAAPSVAYADVGIARHDGTRVRGTSMESERVGLLSDAASISASILSPRRTRDRSGSALSVDSDTAGPASRSRADSALTIPAPFTHETNNSDSPRTSINASRRNTATRSSNTELSPPEYEDIPLTTTVTSHSVNTISSVIPTEPPPTYDGSRIATPESSRSSSPQVLSRGSTPSLHETSPTPSVRAPASSGQTTNVQEIRIEVNSPNSSLPPQSSVLPFRLPSLNLGDSPRISTQGSINSNRTTTNADDPSDRKYMNQTSS